MVVTTVSKCSQKNLELHEGSRCCETPGAHLPWNRAQRRRHAQAKAIDIHLYAGEASKEWCLGWPADVDMITLDVRDGQNVHDAATWAYLWRLAASGRVIAVVGGPPCRTVSRLLEKTPGPPRLRSRNGPERFGFEHLNESQQQKTDSDAAITGELLWLSVRSRPDIAYAVSVMGRNVTKRPNWVQQLGQHVMFFLCNTPETCLLIAPPLQQGPRCTWHTSGTKA